MTTWDGPRWLAAAAELDVLLDLGPEARRTALAALSGRDAALAADVAQLLTDLHSADRERFLDGAAPGPGPLPTMTGPHQTASAAAASPILPVGTLFGTYRIGSALGRGGMGIVYAAEELESGRRLAVKILEQRFTDDRHRENFAREGRLAASIDHPHCVFVFGAGDVDGRAYIAMEQMEGTLADRLSADHRLSPAAAVDAVLQLAAGLDAAAQVGVLHRDVKPSNCFVDADGTVKIGDFGISRSLRRNEDTTSPTRGVISATPLYASPEQLRGDPIDVRADIYSLGATLYELVTGRRPFDAPDLMALLMRIANDPPIAPHVVDAAIPRGLSDVIVRCLAKRPEHRFRDYAALTAALEPFGVAPPKAAGLGRRAIAGAIDYILLGVMTGWVNLVWIPPTADARILDRYWWIGAMALWILYFGVPESLWGASPGKVLTELALADTEGRPLDWRRTWGRAAALGVAWAGLRWMVRLVVPTGISMADYGGAVVAVVSYLQPAVTAAVLFLTARRSNGYAALHDLVTRTRVVERRQAPEPRPAPSSGPVPDAATEYRGSFAMFAERIDGWPGWRRGRDQRLRRPVWLREVPGDAPPIAAARAALTRPTRLRWLAGRRADERGWDVFEAVQGRPLAAACGRATNWPEVRGWLVDLATELAAHGPLDRPPLRLDRVWVLDSGRVKLLDDPVVDANTAPSGDGLTAPQILREVARLASGARTAPWPAAADDLMRRVMSAHPPEPAELLDALSPLARSRTRVSRSWRGLSLVGQCAFALALGSGPLLSLLTGNAARRLRPPADDVAASRLVERLYLAETRQWPLTIPDRDAVEVALASRLREALAADAPTRRRLDPARAAMVDRVLRRHPPGTPLGDAGRSPVVASVLFPTASVPASRRLAATALHNRLLDTAWSALALVAIFRSVMLRWVGLEIVTADGVPASRARVLARAAVGWAPLLVSGTVLAFGGTFHARAPADALLASLVVAVQCGGAAVAVAWPARGIQDRVAGTWLVPR